MTSFWYAAATVMVTGIWGAAVVAIITVGAEAVGITMDGHAADIAAGANSNRAICGGRRDGDHAWRKGRVAWTFDNNLAADLSLRRSQRF
jgi:hypothetical protein